MVEEKLEALRSTVKGWIKAAVTSVVGLVSGAILMYLTPLVNNVIKPAKPLANFAAQVNGGAVDFDNRSSGGVQGWWDFGDGTALEPFDPKASVVKHIYAKPGSYSVKLSLKNLIGEDSDRTVPVTIDAVSAAGAAPEISEFALEPIVADRVPAAYRIRCKVKNVSVCVLSSGDGSPPVIVDGVALDGRSISFNEMGAYTVSVFAITGKQLLQKSADVNVGGAESPITARLSASFDAVLVERRAHDWKFYCAWQGDPNESTSAVHRERLADADSTIASAELVNADDANCPMRGAKLEIAPDKKKLILTGELTKSSGLLTANNRPPFWLAKVKVVLEHRSAVQTFNRGELPMALEPNRTVNIPLQRPGPGWEVVRENVNLELWDGNHKAWSGSQAITGAPMMLNRQKCYVSVQPQPDGYLVTVETPTTPQLAPPSMATAPPLPSAAQEPRPGPYIRPVSFDPAPLLLPLKPGQP